MKDLLASGSEGKLYTLCTIFETLIDPIQRRTRGFRARGILPRISGIESFGGEQRRATKLA